MSSNEEQIARIGKNIEKAREQKGWSQNELARQMVATGWGTYSSTFVSRTERGNRVPKIDEMIALAEVLGTSLDSLAFGDKSDQLEAQTRTSIVKLSNIFEQLAFDIEEHIRAQEHLKELSRSVTPRIREHALLTLEDHTLWDAIEQAIKNYSESNPKTSMDASNPASSAQDALLEALEEYSLEQVAASLTGVKPAPVFYPGGNNA